jgi:16S rRNA (guanine1207-N2)-methyltransferase
MKNHTKNSVPYNLEQVFQIELNGQPIRFVSKPGLPNWNQLSPSVELIADYVVVQPGARVIYFGYGHGAGLAALARRDQRNEFWLYDTNYIALQMAKQTLEINQIGRVTIYDEVDFPETQRQGFDIVVIDLPKGRILAQSWLLKAYDVLKPGGHLYLAGSKNEGVQTAIKDAGELFGEPGILGYKKGNRIARYVNPAFRPKQPVWALRPGIAPHTWHEMDLTIKNHALKIFSLPGIFSYDRLDSGTRLLLEKVDIQAGSHVLDLGCGYGVIGIIASLSGAAQVDLVDVNLFALAAARKNILANGITNALVFPSDALGSLKDQRYAQILTNPPFHAGKAVDYQMAQAFIEQSWQRLEPGGQFYLVANQFIRYDNIMKLLFRRTTHLAESGGFRIWQGTK